MAATLPKPPMMTSARGFPARLTTVRARGVDQRCGADAVLAELAAWWKKGVLIAEGRIVQMWI
jgi:hypothetical protein